MRAWTFLKSLIPGDDSAPLAISRAAGLTAARASAAFAGLMPPARRVGTFGCFWTNSPAMDQSKVFPVPP